MIIHSSFFSDYLKYICRILLYNNLFIFLSRAVWLKFFSRVLAIILYCDIWINGLGYYNIMINLSFFSGQSFPQPLQWLLLLPAP